MHFDKSSARRRGVQSTTPLAPLSCASISHCALKPSAARALTSPTCRLGPLLASSRSIELRSLKNRLRNLYVALRDDARKGTRAETLVPRGDERASSPTTQIAQKNHGTGERSGRGSASHTPPTSTWFFKAR